jgi:hypothetical protein
MAEKNETTSIEREAARGDSRVVPPVVPQRARDLYRPQRMLGVVLWIALLLVVVWLRTGTR